MATDKQQGRGKPLFVTGSPDRARALANNEPVDGVRRPEQAADAAQKAPQAESQGASAPEGVAHRLAVPTAPAAKTDADISALRHLRAALEQAGYRNHPQALEAALEAAELVPVLRAGRGVQAYRAEVLDYLRGKIKQRDARGQA